MRVSELGSLGMRVREGYGVFKAAASRVNDVQVKLLCEALYYTLLAPFGVAHWRLYRHGPRESGWEQCEEMRDYACTIGRPF